jgi:hypothetical protein
MSDDVKKKSCKRCHRSKLLKEFVPSAMSKDGTLGYCRTCWSAKMEEAAQVRSNNAKPRKAKIGRPEGGKTKNKSPDIQAANDALMASGSVKEKFLVRANDGDVSEFTHEGKALRQAMEWKMAGFVVTVWRQCEFEMVLRIIG